MSNEPLLRATQLGCVRQAKFVFENLSFELSEGELLLVEGANGSGKSSLLRLLTGLATSSSGEIFWRGNTITSSDFREHLHYIGHANGLKLGLTVGENLSLFANGNHDDILSTLKLNSQTLARSLSAGQKRKLALARLFLLPKKCWILDEPLTALDSDAQTLFLSALENHLEKGGVAVMSSHQGVNIRGKVRGLTLA